MQAAAIRETEPPAVLFLRHESQEHIYEQGMSMLMRRSLSGPFVVVLVSLMACDTAESQVGQADGGAVRVPFVTDGWRTDFSKHSVPLDEIISGGPPKDGIPPIDRPKFDSVREADRWLGDREPIVVFEQDGEVRGYPWQVLIWHEIVNDEVGGLPVSITYCPLCNTAIAFDRRVGSVLLDFGTTGKLRHSDLVMYDRQTETWWQQATGEAIIGELTGTVLTFLPARTVSWRDFKREYPDARVLNRDTGHRRPYGTSPYDGYDTGSPWLFRGRSDSRLPAMARVVVVKSGAAAVVYPTETLAKEKAINHEVGETAVAVFYRPGTASAVDARQIEAGRDVGAAAAYHRTVDGRTLTFRADGDGFRDRETGTRWTFFGEAIDGPLAGVKLEAAVHYIPFWFAWAAFAPETPVYGM